MIETMLEEKLSYSETARRFEVNDHHRIQDWERIYLTEDPEAFAIERRGRSGKGNRQSSCPKRLRACRLRFTDGKPFRLLEQFFVQNMV